MTIDWELVSDEVARNVSADDLDKTEVDSELLDVGGQPIKQQVQVCLGTS